MTDNRDPKLEAAYHALGAEEPPRTLDEAILGAARRSVQPWTRRWAVPLSLAAVVVLSVTVTLRIQHEQPELEIPSPAKKEAARADKFESSAPPAQAPARAAVDPVVRTPQPKVSSPREADAFPRSSQDRAPAENRAKEETAPKAAPLAETPALAKRADARSELGAAAGSVAAPPAPAAAAPAMRAMQRDRMAEERTAALTPEKELESIAELRKQGKHEEADKALAEFRKRHPDFKIPAAMLERVERR